MVLGGANIRRFKRLT